VTQIGKLSREQLLAPEDQSFCFFFLLCWKPMDDALPDLLEGPENTGYCKGSIARAVRVAASP